MVNDRVDMCVWCRLDEWAVECYSCCKPARIETMKLCQGCSQHWHAHGASAKHVLTNRHALSPTTTAELEDHVQEKLKMLQEALDVPQDTLDEKSSANGDDGDAIDALDNADDKPMTKMEEPAPSPRIKSSPAHSPTAAAGEDDMFNNDLPGVIVIDDDDDPEWANSDDEYPMGTRPPPLDSTTRAQLMALFCVLDAAQCTSLSGDNGCKYGSCRELSVHAEHSGECPNNDALCREKLPVVLHCEGCPRARTCPICLRVKQRKLHHKILVIDNELATQFSKHEGGNDINAATARQMTQHKSMLVLRKQSFEVEFKCVRERIIRLELPYFAYPPLGIHAHALHKPLRWKRQTDAISTYIWTQKREMAKWATYIKFGWNIVDAESCKDLNLCNLECATWKQFIHAHADHPEQCPPRISKAIDAHQQHCRNCTYAQCLYCNMMRMSVYESKVSLARTHLEATEAKILKIAMGGGDRDLPLLRVLEIRKKRLQHYLDDSIQKKTWFMTVLPLWSQPHTPALPLPARRHYGA
ncbi:Aste57867_2941 [Aphanomyces stellatus]|uniref:Aste57867_2941 protein n=1 Tax=Aphanomyces stellatus TaxID=120398 RepID=A0A485KCY3_9STRA|nr:hypothetical protein As57867_002933 [Aphanomyces stellatus]VFT80124.1 Aste57867_2941 [Aphanomyces stellatus]